VGTVKYIGPGRAKARPYNASINGNTINRRDSQKAVRG